MRASMDNPQAPEMVVIAEVCCSPREVRKILVERAEALLKHKNYAWQVRTREWLVKRLYEFLDRHHYAGFQRKKTVETVAKRVFERWKWEQYRISNESPLASQEPRSVDAGSTGAARLRTVLPRRKYRRPKQRP